MCVVCRPRDGRREGEWRPVFVLRASGIMPSRHSSYKASQGNNGRGGSFSRGSPGPEGSVAQDSCVEATFKTWLEQQVLGEWREDGM